MSETFSFGTWLALRRKALDLTQRALAAHTNCALATIKKIEQDERRPSRALAEALARVLHIPADSFTLFVACARGIRAAEALASVERVGAAARSESRAGPPVVNLPAQPTPFIGREAERTQIATYLEDPACRLLTLVGPGGIGKTRLAYQAAAAASTSDFRSGVYAVPLAGVTRADSLLPTIAECLNVTFQSGVDPKAQLLHFLRHKRLLLVLDNLEQLLDGVGLLADILATAPGVKILATSRERLNLSDEWLFPVGGLPFPTAADQADRAEYSAVDLFEGCARRALPNFRLEDTMTAVIRVCQLLEGMPLAIELAAGWVRQMSCEQIVAQIQRDVHFLSVGRRDVPERHRSIRALFDHSWHLLSTEEQAVMMKLAVFRGGFELAAAHAVAGATVMRLASLKDKSLVQGSLSERYTMHELIRQYAESRLQEAGQSAETQNRHLEYFTTWAETVDKQLHTGEQIHAARRMKAEYTNLQTALAWAFAGGDPHAGLHLSNVLWFYWFRWSGNWDEGFAWIERGLNQTTGITPARADAYANAGTLAAQRGDLRTAIAYTQQGFACAQELDLPHMVARYVMGMSFHIQEYPLVAAQFEEAIALLRQSDPRFLLSTALFLYGDRARVEGDLTRAQSLYDEGLRITRGQQDWELLIAIVGRQGRLAALKGEYQKARQFYLEGIDIARQMDSPVGLDEYLIHFGGFAIYQGEYESAERHLNEALALAEAYNNVGEKLHARFFMAELALHRHALSDAARLLAESFTMTLSDLEWQSKVANHEFNTERLIIAGKVAG
ncbi:MAG: helix-turn-helix domain-containing protein, partial [Roseiflexaceae bacterium]|nr:helix-turn-helix domain-containing protein [Roseiflexaceae bacterium]